MGLSVVGLPHYTIWHLYEPSVEDLKHMEEMEQERILREKEEEEKRAKQQKLGQNFADTSDEWQSDKAKIGGSEKGKVVVS